MTHTIEISTEAVAREVYALAALRYINAADGAARPALITRGHENLITDAAGCQLAMLGAGILHLLDDIDPDGRDDGAGGRIMSLTLREGIDSDPGRLSAIRHAVEHILALRIMEAAHYGTVACMYGMEAQAVMPALLGMLSGGGLPRRRQCWV